METMWHKSVTAFLQLCHRFPEIGNRVCEPRIGISCLEHKPRLLTTSPLSVTLLGQMSLISSSCLLKMPFHLQQFIASNDSGIQTLQLSSFDHGLFQVFFRVSLYIQRKITGYDSSKGSRNFKMDSSRIYLKNRPAGNNTSNEDHLK